MEAIDDDVVIPATSNIVLTNTGNKPEPMPEGISSPIAKYYMHITWYPNWNLVRFSTPMDGNCLFHAICNSYFTPYHTQTINGKKITHNRIIHLLRKGLADELSKPIVNEPNAPRYYDILNAGYLKDFAKDVPEFSLEHMKKQLNSTEPIGYGYMQYIGLILDKDIYILNANTKDIYISDELVYCITGKRQSIVLYYINDNHYELVGIKKGNKFITYFDCRHSFIQMLYRRVCELTGQ